MTPIQIRMEKYARENASQLLNDIKDLEKKIKKCQINTPLMQMVSNRLRSWRDRINESELAYYESEIKRKITGIQAFSEIARYRSFAEELNTPLEEIEKTVKPWLKKSYEHEAKKLQDRIELKIQYTSAESEIVQIKEYLSKLEVPESEIKIRAERWKKQSQQSIENEKKSCSPEQDLRNATLGTPRNQGDIGWCFAFALADALSYKLGKKISAADIAIQSYNNPIADIGRIFGMEDYELFFGVDHYAFKRLQKAGGACLESNFKSEDLNYASIKNTLQDISTIKKYDLMVDENSICYDQYKAPIQALFPNLKNAGRVFREASSFHLTKDLADQACGKRIDISHIKSHFKVGASREKNRDLIQVIDQQLNQKNILSVGFDAQIINTDNLERNKLGLHANTIVGRRYNEQKDRCEYLFHNTWGESCTDQFVGWECDAGSIWMPKWIMVEGLLSVNYLE